MLVRNARQRIQAAAGAACQYYTFQISLSLIGIDVIHDIPAPDATVRTATDGKLKPVLRIPFKASWIV
jgi:hypothetical protein